MALGQSLRARPGVAGSAGNLIERLARPLPSERTQCNDVDKAAEEELERVDLGDVGDIVGN